MSSTTEFGESNFGERLNFKNRPCRDWFCALIFWLHVCGVIGGTLYIWIVYREEVLDQFSEVNPPPLADDFDYTGIFVAIPVCALCGLLFGLLWLQIMKLFAAFIIKSLLIINIILWLALLILAVIAVNIAMIVVTGIFFLLSVLYTWCIWGRVKFSTELIKIAIHIFELYKGMLCVSFMVVIMDFLWLCLWGALCLGYLAVATHDGTDRVYGWAIFLMLISLYWGCCVNSNVGHTAYCGVAGVWFFSSSDTKMSPSWPSYGRAMTTQFGSICFGSLLVSLLEALRAMINSMANSEASCVSCLCLCCLSCIQWIIEYFNKYAYCHCAVYGTSFITSAGATWRLFKSQGILALINDDLSGSVFFFGSLITAIVTGVLGWGIGYAFYDTHSDANVRNSLPVALAVYGAIIGFLLCLLVLTIIKSGITTMFVLYAEEPRALKVNHPEDYASLTEAQPKLQRDVGGSVPTYDVDGAGHHTTKHTSNPSNELVSV